MLKIGLLGAAIPYIDSLTALDAGKNENCVGSPIVSTGVSAGCNARADDWVTNALL